MEIPPKQCEIGYLGGGFRHPTENYTINYQGKIYDREYKTLGFSNWLWDYNDLMDNQMVQKDPIYFYRLKSEKDLQKTSRYFLPSAKKPKDPIYFYRLKSEKDLQKTSRYFLPSAKKPITNKIILALDIWGYFMTNWFWRMLFSLCSVVAIGELSESEKYISISKRLKKTKSISKKPKKIKSNNILRTNSLLDKIDTFLFKILAIIYIVLFLSLFFY
ncbi:hypothetical protein HW49_08880 [Porphyromonadaceae bacterium COT-184 OH4590]|nr:hypothetical protein HW49_08880 [Porphyromonadaceae bacterium COT-184 OH4590]